MAKASRKKREDRAAKRAKVRESSAAPGMDGGGKLFNLPDGVGMVKLKSMLDDEAGTVMVDHLPYIVDIDNHPDKINKGDTWYRLPFKLHRDIGPEGKMFVCPTTFGNRCAVCEQANTLRNDDNADWETDVKPLFPKNRMLYGVRISERKSGEEQTGVWEISYHNYAKQLKRELDDDTHPEEYLDFFEPDGGSTLRVRFEQGNMKNSSFPEADRIDFREREEIAEKDYSPCLDHVLKPPTFEETEAYLWGAPVKGDEKEEVQKDAFPDDPPESTEPEDTPETKLENKCPHGLTFGTDHDSKDVCEDECEPDTWEKCQDRKDELKAESRANKRGGRGKR